MNKDINSVPAVNKFIQKGKFREAKSALVAPENSGLRFVLNPMDVKATFQNSINVTVATKWKKVREEGKAWHANQSGFKLGEMQSVAVQSDVWVLNLVLLSESGNTTKVSLDAAFKKAAAMAKYEKASIHMSQDMLNYDDCKEMATKHFIDEGINVYVYKP